jgi:hypothetical protein
MPEVFRDDPNDGDGASGGSTFDPGALGSSTAAPAAPAPSGRRKRSDAGQPRGTRNTQTKASFVQVDLSSITGLFVGLHLVIAQTASLPELAITDDEGEQFMKVAQNVMRHYNVQTTQKTLDWVAFAGVTATIYGTRVYAIMNREPSRPAAPSRPSATVTPLRPSTVAPQAAPAVPHSSIMDIIPDQFGAGDISAE